jgi:hypothetical protein
MFCNFHSQFPELNREWYLCTKINSHDHIAFSTVNYVAPNNYRADFKIQITQQP